MTKKTSKNDPQNDSKSDPLWEALKQTTIPKKSSPEQEGLLLQRKVEIKIPERTKVLPKPSLSGSFDINDPGFLVFKGPKRQLKKIEIAATVDLHGMTKDRAFERLSAFIKTCYGNGTQELLVITGKGLDTKQSAKDLRQDPSMGKGVLKRSLPGWLRSHDLAPYIHHFTNDHPFEGGTGAFYVRLRRNKSR